MKRISGTCALIVLAAMSAACGFKIFEDVGADPHPPTVEITALVHYVAPVVTAAPVVKFATTTTIPATSSAVGRPIAFDSGGFALSAGQRFQLGRSYADAGGDIVKFRLRDRDGPLDMDLTPIDQTYYSGIAGTVIGPVDGIELTGIFGRHRLELWAEDSHGSRSEKVEFVITYIDR